MKNKQLNLGTGRHAYKRVRKARSRAQWASFFYLLATLAMTGLAVLPIFNSEKINYLSVIPGLSDGKLLWQDLKLGLNLDTVNRALYAVMLVVLLVNLIRVLISFIKSFKQSEDIFNHGTRCMKSASGAFSSSFAVILIVCVLIAALNGTYAGADKFKFDKFNDLLAGFIVEIPVSGIMISNMLVILAVGVLFRLLCGFIGGKVSHFTADMDGDVTENKRMIGRFASLFRNFLQLIVVVAIPMFLLQVSTLDIFVADALNKKFAVDIPAFIQLGILLFWIVLVVHATNATEYNINGAKGKGMKNFTIFSLLVALAAAGLYYMTNGLSFDFKKVEIFNSIMLVAVPFVMFIIQVLMRKAPGMPKRMEVVKTKVAVEEEQILYDEI